MMDVMIPWTHKLVYEYLLCTECLPNFVLTEGWQHMMDVMIPWTHKCVYLLCTECLPNFVLTGGVAAYDGCNDSMDTRVCVPTVYRVFTQFCVDWGGGSI
jgi:hypothetical protein